MASSLVHRHMKIYYKYCQLSKDENNKNKKLSKFVYFNFISNVICFKNSFFLTRYFEPLENLCLTVYEDVFFL